MTMRQTKRRKVRFLVPVLFLIGYLVTITPFWLDGKYLQATALALGWIAITIGVSWWFDKSLRSTGRR